VDAFGITLYEKIEAMERQLLVPQKLQSLVSPCDENFGFDPNQGEQTSAEWTRIVFHDVITKNIEGPGLGLVHGIFKAPSSSTDSHSGLDASIGFESDRPENVGVFINVTLNQVCRTTSNEWAFKTDQKIVQSILRCILIDVRSHCNGE